MLISEEKKIDFTNFTVRKHVRSNFGEDILTYWMGKESSNIGIQFVKLVKGKICPSGHFERRDLFLLQIEDCCNVFIEPNGDISIQPWQNVTLSDFEKFVICQMADQVYQENLGFVQEQLGFFEAQPWRKILGLTPAQAVEKLRKMGWVKKEEERYVV